MKCSYPLCMLIWQCRSLKQQWLSVEFLIHTISKVLRKYWPRFHTALFIKWENFELFRVQNVLKCKCHGFEGLFSICELLWLKFTDFCRNLLWFSLAYMKSPKRYYKKPKLWFSYYKESNFKYVERLRDYLYEFSVY